MARPLETLLALLTALALVAVMVAVFMPAASAVDPEGERNNESFWEDYFEHPAQCYKHDDERNAHGYLSAGGLSVILNPFNQSWPGDHWEALIVKSGSSGGDGFGNAIYHHPTAGTNYFAPDPTKEVSHWIVCKGTTPDPTTTTVPPTTTTVPPTTTTVPPTTTTVPPTTTTVPPTTTTVPPTTTTTVLGTTITSPSSTLPFTGIESDEMVGIAIMLLGSGILLTLIGMGRREEA